MSTRRKLSPLRTTSLCDRKCPAAAASNSALIDRAIDVDACLLDIKFRLRNLAAELLRAQLFAQEIQANECTYLVERVRAGDPPPRKKIANRR